MPLAFYSCQEFTGFYYLLNSIVLLFLIQFYIINTKQNQVLMDFDILNPQSETC